jgi:hypothetical protein
VLHPVKAIIVMRTIIPMSFFIFSPWKWVSVVGWMIENCFYRKEASELAATKGWQMTRIETEIAKTGSKIALCSTLPFMFNQWWSPMLLVQGWWPTFLTGRYQAAFCPWDPSYELTLRRVVNLKCGVWKIKVWKKYSELIHLNQSYFIKAWYLVTAYRGNPLYACSPILTWKGISKF